MSELPFITVPEAAKKAGVNEETIRRWIKSGKVKASKKGNVTAVSVESLQAHLKKVTVFNPSQLKPEQITANKKHMEAILQRAKTAVYLDSSGNKIGVIERK